MSSLSGRFLLCLGAGLLLAGCSVDLQHDLAEDDANDIYVLLQKNGIETRKLKDEGGNEPRYMISVAKGDVATAAQLLREHSLPRPKADGLGAFRKNKGMIPTQTEERAMLLEALGGEVSNALNRVPGVLEARTIVVLPEISDLTQPDKKPLPSASVFLKYRALADGKTPISEDQIKSFVSTAISEMKKEDVTVLFAQANLSEAEVNPELQLQTVLGIFRMAKGSAGQFRAMAAVVGLLVVAMLAITMWSLVRGSSSSPRPRGRSEE